MLISEGIKIILGSRVVPTMFSYNKRIDSERTWLVIIGLFQIIYPRCMQRKNKKLK